MDNIDKINPILVNTPIDIMMDIHKALHDKRRKYVTINNVKEPIVVHPEKGSREMQFGKVLLTQYTSENPSDISNLVKEGNKITLGINKGEWIMFCNDKLFGNRDSLLKSFNI